MEPTRNLVIVHTPRAEALSDWETVKANIEARAPDIAVRIADSTRPDDEIAAWQLTRPSLVFSPNPLDRFRPLGGKIYAGFPLDKRTQFERLSAAGVPTPETVPYRRGINLNPRSWGEFVIVKPDGKGSSKGQEVRLVRTRSLAARFEHLTTGGTLPMVVQKYVDNVDLAGRSYEYRILTMFGRPIYSLMGMLVLPRQSLDVIADRMDGAIAYNRKGAKRKLQLAVQEDALALALKAAAAITEFPCLGIDIARDRASGRFVVIETNPGGYTWHISSAIAVRYPAEVQNGLYGQFNAMETATNALIERTRAEAI